MSDIEDTRPPVEERLPGYEYPDPTPVVGRPKLRMPVSEVLRTRALIKQQMSLLAAEEGQETFEEADDFEMDNEDWISPYEQVFEPTPFSVDSVPEGDKTAAPTAAEPANPASPDIPPSGGGNE